jgi:ABC-type uncharacterized transport system substrate-binding protein
MRRPLKKTVLGSILFAGALLAVAVTVEAQQPIKIPVIGYLSSAFPSGDLRFDEAFRQGLRDLGYTDGQNIIIEYRYAEGKLDRLPDLAANLVRLKVDLIVTPNTPTALAAQQATKTIPVVFAGVADPIGLGLVTSLAHPGGNITGTSTINAELGSKRLEFLKEVVPKASRVANLYNPADPSNVVSLKELQGSAPALGLSLRPFGVRDSEEINHAISTISRKVADALYVHAGTLTLTHRRQIVGLVNKTRLPAMYGASGFVEAGGLMSYATDFAERFRRAATYVDKILKGTKPADLPVEQPKKFELVINLKTAKQIGLTIPPNVLARADRVIR